MELTVTVYEIDFTGEFYKGLPGKTEGLPENCYPPEESYIEVSCAEFNNAKLPDEAFWVLVNAWDEKIQEEAIKAAIEYEAERGEWQYEQRRDLLFDLRCANGFEEAG